MTATVDGRGFMDTGEEPWHVVFTRIFYALVCNKGASDALSAWKIFLSVKFCIAEINAVNKLIQIFSNLFSG